ncbi:uncharacterized protein LOC128547220 [Mercenaria mercenaria]|uniref:uncharacterized protein LOC128547220 n=1 Tax=Mercenaria mercenaria TaxID=6596 RepID=UPI00234F8A12|nr:uncharacterized protein LOC128547220 [Mercenaria mercenaria]
MSTSPSSVPGSEDIDQDRVPPGGQDEVTGEVSPHTPPSSPTDPKNLEKVIIDDASSEVEKARGITPGTEDVEEAFFIRETADGVSEKEQHHLVHDLDKDIDAVLEFNVRNGQVDPDGSGNIQNISVDTTAGSALSLTLEGNTNGNGLIQSHDQVIKPEDENVEMLAERGLLEAGSERSFTSDTDSSAVAESVVKTAISKAVDIVKSEDGLESSVDRLESETAERISEEPEVDVKVGLFQYQDFGGEEEEDEEDDEVEDENGEINVYNNVIEHAVKEQKDSIVGLFQYADTDRDKSPVVSEIDDVEDQFESMNEDEKTNILKLYGLEGVEPVSPKSASPSGSGTNSLEEKSERKIFDVQREVYEPSTRHFSVTRDTSSNESTPRIDENGIKSDKPSTNSREDNVDSDGGTKVSVKPDITTVVERHTGDSGIRSEGKTAEIEVADSDTRSADKSSGINNVAKAAEASVLHSVSPPLVQYEPVKENGKFRIIKTSKEGGGSSYSGIRVGADVMSPRESPRSTESQNQSPRGNVNGEDKHLDTFNESQKNTSVHRPGDIKSRGLEENVSIQSVAKPYSQQDIGTAKSREKGQTYSKESVELDREKIRKLLEKENETGPSRLSSSYDTSVSKDSGLPRSQYSGKLDESDKKSAEKQSLPHLRAPEKERDTSLETDLLRIRYTTRDTAGREVKRIGPEPYDSKQDRDRLTSDSRYLKVNEEERPQYDRDRYLSEDLQRSDVTRDSSRPSPSSYEEELLRRAYERVSYQSRDKPHTAPASRSHESSAIIPGFKTLQDQQAKWSDMFHKVEDEHRRELRSQYERHQYNIQRLQQQMELELQKQHLAIRKKLDIHKEALVKMSPDRISSTRHRSPDRSISPDRGQRSPNRSKIERSAASQSGDQVKLSALQGTFDSKTWREIYREVREEEEKDHSPSRPLKRSLDDDFATMDTSLERSRPSGQRSSPRGSSDLSRSGSRDRPREVTGDSSQITPTNYRLSKAERDRSLSKDGPRQRSPEGRDSRSLERESRSITFGRESVPPLHLGDGAPQESVSRHVKELLDNLNDSRHSLHDLEGDVTSERPQGHHGDVMSERPRAGVYSSPMPLFSSARTSKSTEKSVDTSATMDISQLSSSLPAGRDRAEFYSERPRTTGGRDRTSDLLRMDDSCLSPSTRMNLREKHTKHLADLRAYYEDELRELRKALSDTMDASAVSADTSMHSSAQSQLLEAENRQLTDKSRMLEDEIEELQKQIRTLEQKNHGLEKRASEYAAAYTDSQTMSIQHRAHIEELQRYCRERDDLINDLESKMMSNEDSVKIYKKNLEDEMELHRQDKIALQRMNDRYESLEREFKLLQETMSTTENKLYETRTEVVELNRTISKLELENKRLGRENDNLRHKVTQSLNLSALHESFGSPSSPREVQNSLKPRSTSSAAHDTSLSMAEPGTIDSRVPGFATSLKDWTPAQKSRPKSAETNRSRTEELNISRQSVVQKEKKESKSRRKETGESSKGRQSDKSTGARHIREDSSLSSSREDVTNRSQSRRKDAEERPVRDRTPPRRDVTPPRRELTPTRSLSPSSQAGSEVSDYSPLLKAERELFKLRDMMRQAVAVKPSLSPPQMKLQKKFYGSERPSSADEYNPDLGIQRGRKEKPSISSHSSVAKTKSSQTPVKSDKSSSKRSGSGKSEKSSKSKDRGSTKDHDRRDRGKEKSERESGRQREKTPPRRDEFADSSTRFNIDFNEADKSVTVTPRKSENQSGKQKNLVNGDVGDHSKEVKQGKTVAKEKGNNTSKGAEGQLENTLEMMRSGQYTSRPEWENIYTSLAKPKSETQDRPRNMEEKVKERLQSIAEMESRYDGLQVEKRQLESSINKIPLHGRVDRNNRKHKEELENQLDAVERELGSLRMTLKRYNVLKTAG